MEGGIERQATELMDDVSTITEGLQTRMERV
jgi:hypothetical protein